MFALLTATSQAQVADGDFEAGALGSGWADRSTPGGEASVVVEGTSYSSASVTTGITFASPTHALLLRGGWVGYVLEVGRAGSDPVLVTRETLALAERSETVLAAPRVTLADEDGDVLAIEVLPPTVGLFGAATVDLSPFCGQVVVLELESFTNNFFGGTPAFTLFDDVALAGAPCADWDDADGDGWCEVGRDLDADGACDGPGESPVAPADCDDGDAGSFPGAPEISLDGIDQDCDGADLVATHAISGTIVEDTDGDGLVGGAPGAGGVAVALWQDGGDGVADGADDLLLESAVTSAGGAFSFAPRPDGVRYWVVVDSATVAPSASFEPGSGAGDVAAEQTWATAGAHCADGLGGTVVLAGSGGCFGGRRGDVSDAAGLGGAEHLVELDLSGADATVDLAFSFAVVTGVADDGQGSLRQALENANALAGGEVLRFVPAVPPNSGTWWTVALASPLPDVVGAGTVIDGTASCNDRQCAAGGTRDENPGTAGAGMAVGLGPDRMPFSGDEPAILPWPRPELEIDAAGTSIVLAADAEVRALAVYRGGVVLAADGAAVADAWVGPRPDGSVPEPATVAGVTIAAGADDVSVVHCWVQVDADGVVREGDGLRAEIRRTVIEAPPLGDSDAHAGVRLWVGPGEIAMGDEVSENFVAGRAGIGIEVGWLGGTATDLVVDGNSLVGNGPGLVVREVDPASTLRIEGNWMADGLGPGVVLQATAYGARVTANGFGGNAGPAIDHDADALDPATSGAGDGVTPNDGAAGPLDAPILEVAELDGVGDLRVAGFVGLAAAPGPGTSDVEVYLADDDGDQAGEAELGDGLAVAHGEPQALIGTCPTDGSGRFDCTFPVPAFLPTGPGVGITAVALQGDETSEAGPNAAARDASPDSDGDGLTDYIETRVEFTDPLDPDSDADRLSDGDEVVVHGTLPRLPDTDGGGVDDGTEVLDNATDPLDPADDVPLPADTDGDGLLDEDEVAVYGTDPLLADTDGGGADDGTEVATGTDPLDPADDPVDRDADDDGLDDEVEAAIGTDPLDPDTDADTLGDAAEWEDLGTNPLDPDTDGDDLDDAAELDAGTDPLDPDTDGGTAADGVEVANGTDPLDPADDVPPPPTTAPPADPGKLGGSGGCGCDPVRISPGSWAAVALVLARVVRRRRKA